MFNFLNFFKRKNKITPKDLPFDKISQQCQAILDDLDGIKLEDWEFKFVSKHTHLFKLKSKSIRIYFSSQHPFFISFYKDNYHFDLHKIFTNLESKTVFCKCLEIRDNLFQYQGKKRLEENLDKLNKIYSLDSKLP